MKSLEQICHINSLNIDVHEIERLQLGKYMGLFLDNVQIVVLLTDKNLYITYCSAHFLELMGVESFDEVKGKHILDVYRRFADEEFIDKARRHIQSVVRYKKTVVLDASITAKASGRVCIYAIQASPLIDDNAVVGGFCVIFHDITDVMNARRKAEEVNRAKNDFFVKISREIHTSMNAIVDMSMFTRTDNLDDMQKHYFANVKNISQSLFSLANDILDFSNIEAGKVELAPRHFNIKTLFDNIASLFHFIISGKSLSFKAALAGDVPSTLFGDETRIKQIMVNLLNNAVKCTGQGGVEFSLFIENKMLGVKVRDTGAGIKDEDIPTVFDSFERFKHETNRGVIGVDLGLPIVKQLVDLMCGSIKVESVYGKGSIFTVFLPFEVGNPDNVELLAEASPCVIAKNRDEVSILVVDDMPMNLTIAIAFLERHNLKADVAMSGRMALQMVQKKRYDIVFIDHMMSEMNGLETTEHIRSISGDAWFKKMPIIALTANAGVEGVKAAFLKAGANDVISKPIEYLHFNRVLCEWLPADKIVIPEDGRQGEDLFQGIFDKLRHIRGLDVENGVSYTGDSIDNYLEALRQFCRSFDKRKTAILYFLKQGDWKNYLVYIHSFKGVTAIIGIPQLSDKAGELEAFAKEIINNDITAHAAENICKAETQVFLASLGAFKDKFELVLGDSYQSVRNSISAPALIERLKALKEACEAYKANQAADIIAKLAIATYSKTVDRELGDVSLLIASLDYEQAVVKIERLLKELSKDTPPPKSRILVVDDDSVNHTILNNVLAPEYEPIFVFTAQEAFASIEKEKPDLVLLDVILPEMDGFDALKELKSKPETASIPVIVITALNNFEDEERGLFLGAADFITKPFRPTVVKARIRTQLRNLQHFRKLEKAGFIDELTGVPNRRCFNDRIEVEWKRAERNQNTLSFCMIDVDRFKEYNDTYGHPQGDLLLQAVADVLAATARRSTDVVARLGGEEFGVLLTDAAIDTAVEIAEQIRQNVQDLVVPTAEGLATSVTVSIGVDSAVPGGNLSYENLLAQADRFLYLAKNMSRNRVCSPLNEGAF
jgi:diguanylate cyclase (GGDEF)-like protein/PAS domain S-box-containing protein